MRTLIAALLGLFFFTFVSSVIWRWASRRFHLPCPAEFEFMLENPYVRHFAGAKQLIQVGEIQSGMSVLDVGCGPGRVTLPMAEAVGEDGTVTVIDMQEKMLNRVRERARQNDLGNIEFIHGGAGSGLLPQATFDRARLRDIERLALGGTVGNVEQDDVTEFLERGEVGQRAADLASADEGNLGSSHGALISDQVIRWPIA